MTTPGFLLIPLSLLLILLPWRYSFAALFVLLMLSDAAVFVIGSFGIAPAFFYGTLMIGRCAMELALGRGALSQGIIRDIYPLMLFFALNIIILWVAVSTFQGKIDVVTGTMGFNMNLAQAYHLTRENFTQIAYLAFHIALIYTIAYQLMRIEPGVAASVMDRAVVLAMLFAAGIIFWEMAGYYAGIPFPTQFFHSDLQTTAWGQVLAGQILRASGPFPEPSKVGFAFAGFALYAWKRYKLGIGSSVSSMGLILICLIVLAASTSTTAFAAIGLFVLTAAKDMLGLCLRPAGSRSGMRPQDLAALVLLGLGLFGVGLYLSANWDLVNEILTDMVFEKDQTTSFDARSSTDFMAFDILIETGGLGLGLGSHKPNSAVMTILSNTGIPGFLSLGFFFFMRLKPYRPRYPVSDNEPVLGIIPLQWLLIGLIFAHAFSNPNVNHTNVWMVSGMLIGVVAGLRQRLEAPQQLNSPLTDLSKMSVGLHPRLLRPASATPSNRS